MNLKECLDKHSTGDKKAVYLVLANSVSRKIIWEGVISSPEINQFLSRQVDEYELSKKVQRSLVVALVMSALSSGTSGDEHTDREAFYEFAMRIDKRLREEKKIKTFKTIVHDER